MAVGESFFSNRKNAACQVMKRAKRKEFREFEVVFER